MSYPVFHVFAGDVLPVFFNSFDKDDGSSITMTGLAVTDIEIYKDGGVTQRSSDAGYTLLDTDGIDFDGITGLHGFSIDTGDNTDAGFYTVGSWFTVVVSAITIDSVSVSFVACMFRLMKAESIAGVPKADVDSWLGTAAATPTVAGVPEMDVTHWNGTAVSAPSTAGIPEVNIKNAANVAWASGAITAAVIAADAIGASELAADAIAEIADAVWDEDATGHQTQGTFGQAIGDPVADTNTIYKAVVTDATGATVGVDVVAVKAETAAILDDTDDIGVAGAGLSAIPWNASWDAEVQSEVDDALVVQRLDELLNADSDIDGAAPPTVGSVFHELMSKTAGSFTFDQTTDSLEAVRDKEIDIETDTQDIQSRLPAALTGDGNIKADTLRVGGTLQTAGDIIGDTNDIQTRLPAALVSGRMDSDVGALQANVITAAALAADAGTEIAAAVWDRLTTALTTVGSIGKLLVDRVDATISSRSDFDNALDTVSVDNLTSAAVGDILTEPLSNFESGSFRSLSGAIAKLVNRVRVAAGVLTVYKTDDTTAFGTQNVTSSSGADPITEVDTN